MHTHAHIHTHAHTPHKHTHRHTHFFPFSGFSVGLCIKEDGPSLARTNILTGCFSRHQGESVNPPNVLTHPSHIGSPACWWFLWPCHGGISPHLSSHGSDDGRIQSGDTCPCAWASCLKTSIYTLHTHHTSHAQYTTQLIASWLCTLMYGGRGMVGQGPVGGKSGVVSASAAVPVKTAIEV